MQRITDGTVRLYTQSTGLLSTVGHDLCLGLERFEIAHGDGRVRSRFWLDSGPSR